MILIVLGMPIGCHGPDGVLQADGGFPQGPAVKRLIIPARVDYRDEVVLEEKEVVVSVTSDEQWS